jgi:hypothetical protein
MKESGRTLLYGVLGALLWVLFVVLIAPNVNEYRSAAAGFLGLIAIQCLSRYECSRTTQRSSRDSETKGHSER